jgi:hypothetical protein
MSNTLEVALEGLIPSLDAQVTVSPTGDKLPIMTSVGLKYVTPTRLTTIASIDPVPIDSTPGTIDVTGSDERIKQIGGTGTLITVTADEDSEGILEFLVDGGTLVHGASLTLPGSKDIVWAAGDRAYYEGQAGAVTNISRFERRSGVPVNKGTPVVKVVSYSTDITIATALNNGDTLEGIALVTGDLVLVANQTDASENGIYTVGPSPARTTNFDNYEAFVGLRVIEVQTGTDVEGEWFCTSLSGGTIDTDDLDFIKVQGTIARQDANALDAEFVWNGLKVSAPLGDSNMVIANGDTIIGGDQNFVVKLNGASREISLLEDIEVDATLAATRTISAKTTDYVVINGSVTLGGDEQKIFTNTGAGGPVKFTLPTNASCTAGKTKFKFVALVGEDVQVEPASGNLYGYSNASAYTATNGSPVSSGGVTGEWLEVTYMGSNVWHATDSGDWS